MSALDAHLLTRVAEAMVWLALMGSFVSLVGIWLTLRKIAQAARDLADETEQRRWIEERKS